MPKTVLVTGGARGIGKAIVELFARQNHNVIINYLNSQAAAEQLATTLKAAGHRILPYQADVTQKEQVRQMLAWARERLGPIDILVNNAGISQWKLFTEITEAEWDRMLAVHLKGMYHCCQGVVPEMIRQKQGKIINIASVWGMVGAACEVHYATAKAGMIGFTKALAKELGPSGIGVNCVAPGIVATEMLASFTEKEKIELKEETPLQRFGSPEEIAQLVSYLASTQADFITGQVISPNGGFVI